MAVHLMTQSVYSLLQSTLTITQLVTSAKSKGFKAIALTDNKNMFGIMSFVLTCQKHGIKPIVGVSLEFDYNEQHVPFVLLANNLAGYKQLNYLTSLINQEPFSLSMQQVIAHQEDTTMILLGEGGIFEESMMDFDRNTLSTLLVDLKHHLGSFYVGLSMNESLYWKEKNVFLKAVVEEHGLQCTMLSKIYYDKADDARTLLTLEAMRLNKSVHDPSLILKNHRHLLSIEQIKEQYPADVIQTSDDIAEAIKSYDLSNLTTLPTYESNMQVDNKTYLKELCFVGLKKRYPNVLDLAPHKTRLNH